VRAAVARFRNGNEVLHDTRQVVELAPEAEQLIGRLHDRDAFVELHPLARADRGLRPLFGRADAESLVHRAMPGIAAIGEHAAHRRKQQAANSAAREAISPNEPAAGERDQAFVAADIHAPTIDPARCGRAFERFHFIKRWRHGHCDDSLTA
jgi:hypothetical protein